MGTEFPLFSTQRIESLAGWLVRWLVDWLAAGGWWTNSLT